MRSHTIRDLGMDIGGEKFALPFDLSTPYEEILDKTCDLFTNYNDFIYCYNVNKHTNVEINREWDSIQVPCLYEGKDDYYAYHIVLYVFRLKYDDDRRMYFSNSAVVPNDQWMVALTIECGALLEELVELNVLPNVIEKLGLKKCARKFYDTK